jgi:hypothetical protein
MDQLIENVVNFISDNSALFSDFFREQQAHQELEVTKVVKNTKEAFEKSGISTRPYAHYRDYAEIQRMAVENPALNNGASTPDRTVVKLLANNSHTKSSGIMCRVPPAGGYLFVNHPNVATWVDINLVAYQPLKYGVIDCTTAAAQGGFLNKCTVFASKMFQDGWYCYLTNILGDGVNGLLHDFIKSRVGHFTPSYALWEQSHAEVDRRLEGWQERVALLENHGPLNVKHYWNVHFHPQFQKMLPTCENLEPRFSRDTADRRGWDSLYYRWRLPYGYELRSYMERTVLRPVAAVFPDFMLNYNNHITHTRIFANNWVNPLICNLITPTSYDLSTHLLYSGSPVGETVYSTDPLGKEHHGYYACGTIGRRYFIVQHKFCSGGTLVGGGGFPQDVGWRISWRPARMDMPGTIENQAWDALRQQLTEKGYTEDYIKSLEVVSKSGELYKGRFFMPDYLDVNWFTAFFDGTRMCEIFEDYDPTTGITYLAAKVHMNDPRFAELINNRSYAMITIEHVKPLHDWEVVDPVKRDGEFKNAKNFSPTLSQAWRREMCGETLDPNDFVTVVFGQDNVPCASVTAWAEFVWSRSYENDCAHVLGPTKEFAWALNLSREDPRCTTMAPVRIVKGHIVPLNSSMVQEIADKMYAEAYPNEVVDDYSATLDAKEYSLEGSSQEIYQDRNVVTQNIITNRCVTPSPTIQTRKSVVKSLLETCSITAAHVDYTNRLKFFVEEANNRSIEEIIGEIISSYPTRADVT